MSNDIESGDDEEDEDLLAEANKECVEQNDASDNKEELVDTDIPPECQLGQNFDVQLVEGEDCVNNVPKNDEWENDDDRRYDEFANDFIEEGNKLEEQNMSYAMDAQNQQHENYIEEYQDPSNLQ